MRILSVLTASTLAYENIVPYLRKPHALDDLKPTLLGSVKQSFHIFLDFIVSFSEKTCLLSS